MDGRLDPLGVLVPEFGEGGLIEIRHFIADVGDGGLELVAGGRLLDGRSLLAHS